MKSFLPLLIAASAAVVSTTAWASYSLVTNGNNDGQGSLRDALSKGNQNILISQRVTTIFVTEPLIYSGEQRLNISGNGQTIDGSAIAGDGDILSITQGANTAISHLTFIGNAANVNASPNSPVGGKGIDLTVPITRTGLVTLELNHVSVSRVGHHGVHVSDCSLGDNCGSGSGGAGDGSPASIFVDVKNLTINKVGYGRADADGLRVDDRGDGSIYFRANNSTFINVGADGVELDEGNNGNIVADISGALFDSNGEYCNLVIVFDGGPCDDEGDRDVDDGFDIDEAGPGSLFTRVTDSIVSNNFDEGLDFDTQDAGGVQIYLANVMASGNQDEGFKVSEEGSGDVKVWLSALTSVDNNGAKEGIEIEEEDGGDVNVIVHNSNMIGGGSEELKISQADDGIGTVSVSDSNVVLDTENVIQQ